MKIGVSSPFEQALPWQLVNTALISHRAIKEPTKDVGMPYGARILPKSRSGRRVALT
jgi:hypothetical protein